MHNLSNVVFCLSIHNNPYICFSKNLLTFNALTLYYFYMKKISAILWMVAIWMMGLMPVRAAAGVPGRDLQSEKGETVICRGVEAHTSGPMLQVGQVAPDFHAVNAKMEEVSLSDFKGKKVILNIYNPQIQISAESGTKRSIFRQKNKTKRSKKRLHTTLIKPEQKVNEDLCSGFIVS